MSVVGLIDDLVAFMNRDKSYTIKRIAAETLAMGGQVVVLDRTVSREYARFAARHRFRARQRRHEIVALVDNLTGSKQGTHDARMGRPPGHGMSLPFFRNPAATRVGLDDVDQVARKGAGPAAPFYV